MAADSDAAAAAAAAAGGAGALPGRGQLEQFLALANSSRGLAAVQLIKTVLSRQGVFVFGPLLAHPNVAALEGTEHAAYLELLRVFAYGTFGEYRRRHAAGELPALDKPQLRKLRQLTIVSEAAASNKLDYKRLMADLEVENVRELEDMIIECLEADLLFGRLDQKELVFEVDHAVGRDIGPGDVGDMIATLTAWVGASERVLKGIEQKIEFANARHAEAARREEVTANAVAAARLQAQAKLAEAGGGGGGGGGAAAPPAGAGSA